MRTHLDPIFGVLDCAPVGVLPVGEACALGPPGLDTGYDDCVAGAVCVDGTCAAFCYAGGPTCSGGTVCEALPGAPEDVGACR